MATDLPLDLSSLGDRPERALFRVLDAAPDALILVDARGTIRFANAQAENLFGYSRPELLGSSIDLLVPERFRGAHDGHRARYGKKPGLRSMGSGLELFGRRKDGSEFPVEISLSPLETSSGVFVSSSIRDISERKRMEAQANLANQRLLSAVESIEGMFALFDADDRLVLANSEFRSAFERALGRAVVGCLFSEIVDGLLNGEFAVQEPLEELRARWLAYHHAPTGSLEVRTREGQTWRVSERRTAEGGMVMTVWDISADARREEELQKARSLAEAANAAKSEFLASMSHELRTPLNAILGFSQLLQRDKRNPVTERQREMLGYILKGGEHLLRLINDVLDLARIEAGRVTISPEPVGVQRVLEEVTQTLEPIATRAHVALRVLNRAPHDVLVRADRTRLAQILMNYGSNAIKYGRIESHVSFVVSAPSAEYLRVSVIDHGLGIPADKQDKIFQPFQRAGQELGLIEGTGIGLAICKQLAELMGGSVGFRSEVGVGSEFWIELRVADEKGLEQTVSAPQTESAMSLLSEGGHRHKVIYIEDNPSNVAFMEELMQDFPRVQLLIAPSAEVGLELIRAHRPEVVIMDINLPGMDGIEAARRLREWSETRDIPVVALSAGAMESDRKRAEASIFHRYLTKPVKVDELIATLEPLLLRD